MRITRLALRNWMNFKDAEINLSTRNFFVGPNASGKSNLLDAFKFLRDLAPGTGTLESAVAKRGGMKQVRSFHATRNADVHVEFDLGDDDAPAIWTYALTIRGSDGLPIIVSERVLHDGRNVISPRPDKDDKDDPDRLKQTALQQVNSNKQFRDIAEFCATIRYLHVAPHIVRDVGRSPEGQEQFGSDLIARIASTPERTRRARLARMQEALAIAVPQFKELILEKDSRGVPHLVVKYQHWRLHGTKQTEQYFSDGTLRLLALIWSLQEQGGPILIEEPELSLNPAIVSQLSPMISRALRRSKRQAIITTHSADLLSENVGLDEIHLLQVTDQETKIIAADTLEDIAALVSSNQDLVGAAVLARSAPREAEKLGQMDLFP